MENANSFEYLEKIKIAVIENLKKTAPVPSVQMQDIPRQSLGMTDEEEAELDDVDEDENKDARMTQRQWEKSRVREDEFEDSDDEEMAHANGLSYDGPPRRSIMDYRNPHAEYDVDSGAISPSGRATPARNGVDELTTEANEPEEVAMEDAEPATAEEDAAKAEKAPEASAKVDEEGDIDMTDATEKATEPAIKEEATEVQSSSGGDEATAEKSNGTAAAPGAGVIVIDEAASPSSEKGRSPAPAVKSEVGAGESEKTDDAESKKKEETEAPAGEDRS